MMANDDKDPHRRKAGAVCTCLSDLVTLQDVPCYGPMDLFTTVPPTTR